MNHLILFGFKSSGKTHLGKKLSSILHLPFIDTDQEILLRYGQGLASIRAVYEKWGEVGFRMLEKTVISQLPKEPRSIIALGGGAILDPDNIKHLKTMGRFIYLKASFHTISARIAKEGIPAFVSSERPFDSLQRIYETRLPLYEAIPSLAIDVDLSDETTCLEAMRQYGL